MTAEGRSTKNLSLTQLNRIDSICAKFEEEQVGENSGSPAFESYLNGFAGSEREELLRELLSLDIELREQRGENPSANDYAELTDETDQKVILAEFESKHNLQSQLDTGVGSDTSVSASVAPNAAEPLEIGTSIGPYELKQRLGEGGMGVVYLAEQSEPIERQVALKVVRSELSSMKVIERFQQERQALAAMDHPNVARVLDAGTSENNAPYFVMELVDGLPITNYCNQNELGIRERLRLFFQVCQAVQHAHQKGIIHRDLKPSNVLVTSYDDEPTPKVIDFGLATAIHDGVIRDQSKTDVGTVMGTFQYMSPEQADTGNADVDTRSDVYSLGVLLFELLTGRTPISAADLQTSSYFEVLQRIREATPTAPSKSIDSLTSHAGCDSPDTKQDSFREQRWKRSLRGDLDWITLRSLANAREERYETALALGDDIQRYLRNEPVTAGPPSTRYRVWKFVRRNRVPVAAASFAALALVVGLVLATVGLVRAKRATDDLDFANKNLLIANKALDRELVATQEARVAEAKAKDRAQTDAATTDAVNRFLAQILQAASPYKLGKEATVIAALDYASKNIDSEFPQRPRVKMSVLASLASTYNALGEYTKAESHAREAVNLYSATVGEEDLSTLRAKDQLATILFARGEHAAAIELMQTVCDSMKQQFGLNNKDTLITLNNLATFLAEDNRLPESIDTLKQVLEGKRELLPENDDSTLTTWSNLSALRSRIGEKELAVEDMKQIFALTKAKHGPKHHQTISALDHLAITQSFLDVSEAIPMYEELVELRGDYFGPDHPMTVRTKLLLSTSHLGQGDAEAAEQLLRDCVAWNDANSSSRGTRFVSASPRLVLALAMQGKEAPEKAEEAEQLANAYLDFVDKNAPPNSPPHLEARANLGISILAQGRYVEAESMLRDCYRDVLKYQRLPPDLVGLVQSQLGIALIQLDRRDEAIHLVKDGFRNLQRVKGDSHVATLAAAEAADELGIEFPDEVE